MNINMVGIIGDIKGIEFETKIRKRGKRQTVYYITIPKAYAILLEGKKLKVSIEVIEDEHETDMQEA